MNSGASRPAATTTFRHSAEADLRQISRDLPGFAGSYLAGGDTLVVLLTRATIGEAASARARAALNRAHTNPFAPVGRFVRFRMVDYDFEQLASWRDAVADRLFTLDEVVMLDADELTNRVTVGVSSAGAIGAAREIVLAAGVPEAAVRFRVVGRLRANNDLYSRIRPLTAGTQVGPSGCTLGAIAWWGGQHVMLIPSHCSDVENSHDHGWVSQPYGGTGWGEEIWDTRGYVCGFWNLSRCREADVSVYRVDNVDVFPGEIREMLGRIARTEYSVPGNSGTSGSITIDAANDSIQSWGDWGIPYVGQPVNKVGVTSGWTTGTVYRTCTDYRMGSIILVCQSTADYASQPGDSGAPVWSTFDGTYFVGMNIGHLDSEPWSGIFSSSQQIRQELGSRQLLYY